jgi:hypothetical protein
VELVKKENDSPVRAVINISCLSNQYLVVVVLDVPIDEVTDNLRSVLTCFVRQCAQVVINCAVDKHVKAQVFSAYRISADEIFNDFFELFFGVVVSKLKRRALESCNVA